MRLISNEELLAVGGGLGGGANRGVAMAEGGGTVSSSWWDSFTGWLSGIFGGGGSSGSSGSVEVQTVIINGGTRFSNMTAEEQDALDMAIAREANPGCAVSIARTNHGGTVTIGISATPTAPGVNAGYSQQGPSKTTTVSCPAF